MNDRDYFHEWGVQEKGTKKLISAHTENNKTDIKLAKKVEKVSSLDKTKQLNSVITKEKVDQYVTNYYFNPGQDIYEKEDNLRLELYRSFSKDKFYKYMFLVLLRWDYTDYIKLVQFYKNKFWKNILSGLKSYTYHIKTTTPVDYVEVNWNRINGPSTVFTYKTYFPFNINVILYKKGCVPMLYRKIWYLSTPVINVSYKCVKLHQVDCNVGTSRIKIGKLEADISNICAAWDVKSVSYAYLNRDDAKQLGYLNLPVFNSDGYKLVAQSFDTYGMPIIILYNKNQEIVNKCVPLYYKYSGNKNVLEQIPSNRYFDAIYWQKKGFPWWWDLDLKKGIWYAGYQQVYDKTNGTFLAKYCYKF